MSDICVKVAGLGFDIMTHQPVVFLKESDGKRALPIWIGTLEAQSIAFAMLQRVPARPLTHDLVKDIIESLGVKLIKVVVNELVNGTYHARLLFTFGNTVTELDARPSDSIAIAVRTSSPIYVASELFTDRSFAIDDKDELKHRFKNLEPEEFGKFNF